MIECKKCGAKDKYTAERRGHNMAATCSECHTFIKNIPYDKPRFYIGKYKHVEIEKIDDIQYLIWAKDNMSNLSIHIRSAIEEQIQRLKMLMA